MTTWFTSDHHFSHDNIRRHCGRPFSTLHEMNSTLVERWNSRVRDGDTVYHLGDFGWNPSTAEVILRRLNGRIILIKGNHDKRIKNLFSRFSEVHEYREIKILDSSGATQRIILCHYPIESWNARYHESWHLHGHIHSTPTDLKGIQLANRLDVGVDRHDFYPISYEEVKEQLTRI